MTDDPFALNCLGVIINLATIWCFFVSLVILLEFDRLLDTSFYLNNIIINGQLLGY